MQTNRLGTVVTTVLVCCAITVTGLVVRRELLPAGASAPAAKAIASWRTYQQGGHAVGPANAAVTIVEFADFECPACAVFSPVLSAVQARHPDDVRIIYRHLPIPLHRYAMPAAIGAECAARQGRYIQMHDALYEDQRSFGTRPWTEYASQAKVPDITAFSACMADTSITAAISQDTRDAIALGAHATPTLLINDQLTSGTMSDGMLEKAIERARGARK